MSLQDLAKSFQMFHDGVKEYAVASGINKAHEQVLNLKSQSLDQLEERQGLTDIANNLTMGLASLGAPLGQIQAAVGAVAPVAFKDAQDMALQSSLMPGAKGQALMGAANTVQKFEEDPKARAIDRAGMWQMKAAEMQGARAMERANEKQSATTLKRFDNLDNELDPTRGRTGPFGQLTTQLNQIEKADALFTGGYDMTKPMTEEVALGLHRLLSGSNAAHVEQVKALIPNTAMSDWQSMKSYFDNNPEKLGNAAFMKKLKETYDREKEVVTGQYKNAAYMKAARKKDLMQKDPERFRESIEADPRLNYNEFEQFAGTGSRSGGSTPPAARQPQSGLPPGIPAGSVPVRLQGPGGTMVDAWKGPDGKNRRVK